MSLEMGRIQASIIDGRVHSPRFRQQQLIRLHHELQEGRTGLVDAIRKDTSYSETEAQIQHLLTLGAIKHYYSEISLDKSLEDEYKLAHSQDNSTKRVPAGYVCLNPGGHDLLYSTIVPVAAAIASGNCVVLELSEDDNTSHQRLGASLSTLLRQALDQDIIALTSQDQFSEEFKSRYCVRLDLRPQRNAISTSKSIKTPLDKTVAIVDRTADLSNAARELVRARFSFDGKSPYAPDLVLVNEFCVKTLASSITQYALEYLADYELLSINGSASTQTKRGDGKKTSVAARLEEENPLHVTRLASGSRGTVLLVSERGIAGALDKITEPLLVLHPVTSMDDAIDCINTNLATASTLHATHLFTSPPMAKYISQFINTSASFTNTIPVELLVGSSAPAGHATQVHPRFSQDLFTIPKPEVITSGRRQRVLAKALDQGGNLDHFLLSTNREKRKQDSGELDISLPPINEPEGGGLGFFEQGIITGGLILLSTVTACVALGANYVAIPLIKGHWRLLKRA
ncbi:hypothetical protein RBB50_009401 [Rhinocladiella similis]